MLKKKKKRFPNLTSCYKLKLQETQRSVETICASTGLGKQLAKTKDKFAVSIPTSISYSFAGVDW